MAAFSASSAALLADRTSRASRLIPSVAGRKLQLKAMEV